VLWTNKGGNVHSSGMFCFLILVAPQIGVPFFSAGFVPCVFRSDKYEARAGTSVGLHVSCPLLLPDFNQNWYISTNLVISKEYKISWKSLQGPFSLCHAHRHGEAWKGFVVVTRCTSAD
jgi:hypothetical protein